MARISKRDWLEAGLTLITEVSAESLTIDALTKRLSVTKGSFYHHFTNYEHFTADLLLFYEQEGTLQIIELTEAAQTPLNKLQRLLEITTQYPPDLEVAFRAWALQDAKVREVQVRIDQRRLAYLCQLCTELLHDTGKAQMMAQLLYTVYVGGQQVLPPLDAQSVTRLYSEINRFYGFEQGDNYETPR